MNAFVSRTLRLPSKRRAVDPLRAASPLEALEPRRLLATFSVDTFADTLNPGDGLTSIREAVNAAIATSEDDQIDIPAGTYVLALGQIDIIDARGAMTLTGLGGEAVIDAGGSSRIFNVEFSDVTMERLRLVGGSAGEGGAINSFFALLSVTDSTISGNSAEGDGGGIYADNSLLALNAVKMEQNRAQGDGGAVAMNVVRTFQIADSFLANNSAAEDGGALWLFRSDGPIDQTQFAGNEAGGSGGALALASASTVTASGASFANNTAGFDGGAVDLGGLSRLNASEFTVFFDNTAARDGGGVHVRQFARFVLDGGGIAQNRAGRAGGGIGMASGGAAELEGVEVFSNTAQSGGGVGSLSSSTSLDLRDSLVGGNIALFGGGTYRVNVEAYSSSISSNIARLDGGGIHRDAGIDSYVRLNDSTVRNNQAQGGRGGGIFAGPAVEVNLAFSEVSFNTARQEGGGIIAGGLDANVRIESSTISNNAASAGGGLYFRTSTPVLEDRVAIQNSTIANNDGRQGLGGGLYIGEYTIFRAANTTISGNRAAGGGGIASEGPLARVSNLTVTLNEAAVGGGLLALRRPFETGNTIYAGNTASVAGPDVWGNVRSLGGNLVGIRGFSLGWAGSDQLGTDAAPLDPQLGALANNGGPTRTHLPASTSPAIDSGINSNALDVEGGTLLRDQRGFERIAGVRVDVGAVEAGAQQPSLIGGPYEIFQNQDLLLDATRLLNSSAQQSFSWYLVPGGFSDNPNGVLIATGPNPTVSWSTLTQLGVSEPGVYGIRMILVEDGQEQVYTTTLTILPA